MCKDPTVTTEQSIQQLVDLVDGLAVIVERLAKEVTRSTASEEEIADIRMRLAALRRECGRGLSGAETSLR